MASIFYYRKAALLQANLTKSTFKTVAKQFSTTCLRMNDGVTISDLDYIYDDFNKKVNRYKKGSPNGGSHGRSREDRDSRDNWDNRDNRGKGDNESNGRSRRFQESRFDRSSRSQNVGGGRRDPPRNLEGSRSRNFRDNDDSTRHSFSRDNRRNHEDSNNNNFEGSRRYQERNDSQNQTRQRNEGRVTRSRDEIKFLEKLQDGTMKDPEHSLVSLKHSMRRYYPNDTSAIEFDSNSFFNFKDEEGFYQPVDSLDTLYAFEKQLKGMDQKHSETLKKLGPHAAFFKQLNEFLEQRKRARMRKAGYKFPDESEDYIPPSHKVDISQAYDSQHSCYLDPKELELKEVEQANQPKPPVLEHNLDRVLFSPGVHVLKDQRTKVYNFDPSLESIMSIRDFDFTKVTPFIPSAQDTRLSEIAKETGKKFTSSTSSLTAILMHFHYLLSRNRKPSIEHLSKSFGKTDTVDFTITQRKPASVFLRYRPETDTYSLDSDKTQDEEIILSLLGHVMETQLTTEGKEFREKYTKPFENDESTKPAEPASNTEEKPFVDTLNTYHYSTLGDFVMRSQIDCYDPRLPGTGVFDLKTRAVCAVRHDLDYAQIHDGSDYQITQQRGEWESYEREQYDLVRTALLKYSLQARIGRMDGIFIAYHNIRKMFGFEYMPLHEIDKIFHTTGYKSAEEGIAAASMVADTEFKMSIKSLSELLNRVIAMYPKQSVNLVFKSPTSDVDLENQGAGMLVFANPMDEQVVDCLQKGLDLPPAPTAQEIEEKVKELEAKEAEAQSNGQKSPSVKTRAFQRTKKEAGSVFSEISKAELREYYDEQTGESNIAQFTVQSNQVESRAYLDRNTIFNIYRDNYTGTLPGLKCWRITFDNFVDGQKLQEADTPVPTANQSWTAGLRIRGLAHSAMMSYLDTVIYGFLEDSTRDSRNRGSSNSNNNGNGKESAITEGTKKQGLAEDLSTEMEELTSMDVPPGDRLSVGDLDSELRLKLLDPQVSRELISATTQLENVSGSASTKNVKSNGTNGNNNVKSNSGGNGRLTSTPDTVRRSQEEIAEYLEERLGKLRKPNHLQTLLRGYSQKGKEREEKHEEENEGKEKIVWTPK